MFHKNVSSRKLIIALTVLIVSLWVYRHKEGNETKYLDIFYVKSKSVNGLFTKVHAVKYGLKICGHKADEIYFHPEIGRYNCPRASACSSQYIHICLGHFTYFFSYRLYVLMYATLCLFYYVRMCFIIIDERPS